MMNCPPVFLPEPRFSCPDRIGGRRTLKTLFAVVVGKARFASALLALCMTPVLAQTTAVPVTNHSFELPVLKPNSWTSKFAPGWTVSGVAGVFYPLAVHLPQGASDGNQVSYAERGSLSQTLSTKLAANTQYTLNVDLRNRSDFPTVSSTLQLLAGSNVLASTESKGGTKGTSTTQTLTYIAGPVDPYVGQALGIKLVSGGQQSNWDNIRLDAAPIVFSCFNERFTGADNGRPSSNWDMTSSRGSFGVPRIINNRLRLTDAGFFISTAAHLLRQFPGGGNKIILEFDHFAYGGKGADGMALAFSDASVPPKAGASGASIGYANDCSLPGFAGGWLGLAIDEYGNFPRRIQCRSGLPVGLRPDSVSVRGSGAGKSGYFVHAESARLSPGIDLPRSATAGPGHRYRATIDSSNNKQAFVTIERDTSGTGRSYATIIPKYDALTKSGQAAVPANWLISFTGSTGAWSNVHEVDNLKICTARPILPALNYLRIEHNGTGTSCGPTTLTIKACAQASCTSTYKTGVTGTLTATGTPTVQWVGGPNFTIGSSGSVTKQVYVKSGGNVAWGATGVSPNPTRGTSCYIGSQANCNLTASSSGFTVDAPDHVANTLQTLKTSVTGCGSGSAPPISNTTKNVTFSCSYANPASGSLPVKVGGKNVVCGTAAQSVPVAFDATGEGSVSLRYADVGRVTLSANYSDKSIKLSGADDFISAPAAFALAPSGPYVAGRSFSATVTAKNTRGGTTPNFGRELPVESVNLDFKRCQPTGTGAVNGIFSGALGRFSHGVASATDLNWSEVGNGDLAVTLDGSGYLGTSFTATANTGTGGTLCNGAGNSGNVGPFKPHHFDTTVTQGCSTGGFTYSGQPFDVRISAMNGLPSPTVTRNYAGTTATSPIFARDVTLSDVNAGAGILSSASAGRNKFSRGAATAKPVFTFTNKLSPPVSVRLRALDTDGVSSASGTEGIAAMRSGRLRLSNVFGSTRATLQMPFQFEYWGTGSWILNNDDNCTALPASAIFLSGNLAKSTTLGAVNLNNGQGTLTLNRPARSAGSVDVAVNLGATGADQSCLGSHGGTPANLLWLRSRNGSCAATYDRDPAARASFGLSTPESNKQIDVRENF